MFDGESPETGRLRRPRRVTGEKGRRVICVETETDLIVTRVDSFK